jgi:hypothetical protein
MRERAYCFYGPGRVYLYYGVLLQGVSVQAAGRNDDGSWVLLQFPDFADPSRNRRCWFATNSVDLESSVLDLEPVYPDKWATNLREPGGPRPGNVQATRSGNLVTDMDNTSSRWETGMLRTALSA